MILVAIKTYIDEIKNAVGEREAFRKSCYAGLSVDEKRQLEVAGFSPYSGKVRDLVRAEDELWIYHSDRLTAFDRYIGLVPFKGLILGKISEFWLHQASKLMPVYYRRSPHPRVICGEAMEPIKAEVIVRGHMAGSMARAYSKGIRNFCGIQLSDGLVEYSPLPQAIITPTTKAEAFEHDQNASATELIEAGICTSEEWDQISEMALRLFCYGQEVYRKKGWILVDTKYEFGRSSEGELKVIDEVHTPDSSRLWRASDYEDRLAKGLAPEMLDKEIVRRYLLDQGFSGAGDVPTVPAEVLVSLAEVYLEVAETLLGEALTTVANGALPFPSLKS